MSTDFENLSEDLVVMARYIKKQSNVNTEELSETGVSIENESLDNLTLEKPVILDEMKTDEKIKTLEFLDYVTKG